MVLPQILTTRKMNKENFIIPVILFFLSIAFLFVSLLVRLRKNNPVLISRKIKLGAAVITLTSLLSACTGNPPIEQETCYKEVSNDTQNYTIKKNTTVTHDTLKEESQNADPGKKPLNKKYHNLLRDSVKIEPPVQNATCYAPVADTDTI